MGQEEEKDLERASHGECGLLCMRRMILWQTSGGADKAAVGREESAKSKRRSRAGYDAPHMAGVHHCSCRAVQVPGTA